MEVDVKSHKETYPEQYAHELCGKNVVVITYAGQQAKGIVERVVSTRWGPLAHLEGDNYTAWRVEDCKVEDED